MIKKLVLLTLTAVCPINGFTKYPSQWIRPNFTHYPLHYVSFLGLTAITEMLIQSNEHNIDAPDLWGRTPLHCAASQGKTETVQKLLILGAKTTLREVNNMLPEELARINGHHNLSHFLRIYRSLE